MDDNYQLYYYNSFPTLLPAFWLPWAALSDNARLQELGAFTLGWDALQFHQHQLAAGYRFGDSSPFVTGAYTLRRFHPVVSIWTNTDLHRQEGTVNVEVPFIQTRRSSWLDLGVAAAHDSSTSTRADLDWVYSSALQYRFGVAPVQGRVVGLHTDLQSRPLFSERNLTRVLGYWFEYLGSPPQTWSLRSKLVIGTAFERDAPMAFRLDDAPGLLGVRGYAEASEPERSVIAAGLQFRTPLWWIERGPGTGPLFLQNINAAGFTDAGLVFDRPSPADLKLPPADSSLRQVRLGVGAELRADLMVAHLLPVSLFAGCGFGLNPLWSYRLYFGVSSSMLAGILGSQDARFPGFRHLPETH